MQLDLEFHTIYLIIFNILKLILQNNQQKIMCYVKKQIKYENKMSILVFKYYSKIN